MPRTPFFVNELYSLGYWLKDYGYYPKSWPLFTYMDHGMTLFDTIPPHELENDAPVMFKFSPRLVEAFAKQSTKPVYCLMNPSIHYRHTKKIEQTSDAKGTLFFPAHTTDKIDDHTNWDIFIQKLRDIPEKFHPIDICLHPTDVQKGLDKIFEAEGFKVYCAGNSAVNEFVEKMYGIMKNYKYTMSNMIGSYVFYSVEMGIPFSLYGTEPNFINNGDRNIESGEFTSYRKQSAYQQAVSLFTGSYTEITSDQKAFVNFELGKTNTISRLKTSFILYKSLVQYLIGHPIYLFRPSLSKVYQLIKAK